MTLGPRNQLLLNALLFVEQLNRRFGRALARSANPASIDHLVVNEYAHLSRNPVGWDVSSDLIRALTKEMLAPAIEPDTLLRLTNQLVRPVEARADPATPHCVTLSETHVHAQLPPPVLLEERVYLYETALGVSVANRELDSPSIAKYSDVRVTFVDEAADPVSVLSEYVVGFLNESDRLVFNVLQRWLLTTFAIQDSEVARELIGQVCRRLNTIFFHTPEPTRHSVHAVRSSTVGTALLISEIAAVLKKGIPRPERAALGLFVLLRLTRTLRSRRCWFAAETVPYINRREIAEVHGTPPLFDCVSALRPCETSYLKNRLFGEQSGVVGLSYVFRGGLLMPLNRGHVTIVSGQPGSGKSVLVLQLMADIAARGGLAVYLSLEETTSALTERMNTFGLRNNDQFDLLPCSVFDFVAEIQGHVLDPTRGLLVLVDCTVPNEPGAVARERRLPLNQIIEQLGSAFKGYFAQRAIALDSLNVLNLPTDPDGKGELDGRIALRDLLDDMRRTKLRAFAISEVPATGALERLVYLADTVIDIGWNEARGRRHIEITKCRTQDYHPGPHLHRIADGRGIRIYPSLAAVRSTTRKRGRTSISRGRYITINGTNNVVQIHEKGSVLISGPEGVGKSRLALELLLQPSFVSHRTLLTGEQFSGPRGVLVVTFATPESRFLRRLNYFDVRSAWDRIPFARVRWYSPGENLAGSQIIDELRAILAESRRSGFPLDRVLFDELEAAEYFLPSLQEDSLFWPTLTEMVTSEPFTTIFVTRGSDMSAGAFGTLKEGVDYCLGLSQHPTVDGSTLISVDKMEGVWMPKGSRTADWRYMFRIDPGL